MPRSSIERRIAARRWSPTNGAGLTWCDQASFARCEGETRDWQNPEASLTIPEHFKNNNCKFLEYM
jgi:hypothetical protein